MIRRFLPLVCLASLTGCLTQPPAPTVDRTPTAQSRSAPTSTAVPAAPAPEAGRTYTVKRGDTLYRIALEHGQDYRDLATWNGLSNPGAIREGQVLRVSPPGAADGAVVARPIASAAAVESRPLDKPAVAVSGGENLKREPKVGKEPYSDEAYARLNRNGATPAGAEAPRAAAPEPRETAPAASASDDPGWLWPANGKVAASFGQANNKGIDIAGKAGDPVVATADGKVVYAGAGLPGYGELVIVKHNATYLSAYGHNRKILVKEGQTVTRGQKIAEMGSTGTDSVKLHFEIRKQGNPVDPLPLLPKR